MKLIRATEKHIEILLEIELTTIGLTTFWGSYKVEQIKKWISEEIVYLIETGKNIVGSVSYEIIDDEHAYISSLIIRPEFQRRGLAKQAMQILLKQLTNFKLINLVTHPANSGAIRLYHSLGFVETSRKENYFGDGEPRITMVKDQSKK